VGSALAANPASSSLSARTASKRAFQHCSSSAATRRALAPGPSRIYHIFLYTFNKIRENVPGVHTQPKVSGPWFVRLLEDKRLLNIADGAE
jgi:hypothetical protein